MTSPFRRLFWVTGVCLFVSYAYFYQAGGWNQNSRFALDRAILERHTLQIDAYRLHTGDIAVSNGHYYSDKAPGASFLALVPVEIARGVSRVAGIDPESFPGIAWTSYIATVATSGLFTVIAALCVLTISLRWGFSRGAALFAATAYGVATPAWCYATLFMGHGLTAGCLMLAFAAAVALAGAVPARRNGLAWTIGLSAGWAVVTEYPAAVPVAFVTALAWLNARDNVRHAVRDDGHEDRHLGLPPVLVRIVTGGGIAAAILMWYNLAAFGSPFHVGYSSEQGFEQMRVGFFGITTPAWWRIRELLVGSYRGLLPLSPLVALTPIGLWLLARTPGRRRAVVVAGATALFYLLLNASYFYWEGGWAYGPRQMTPALPFLALGLAPLWEHGRRAGRIALLAGWTWGAALTLIAVSTTPQPPGSVKAPMRELLWPAFREGDLSLNHQTMVHFSADPDKLRGGTVPHAAWNLGEIAGLKGHASLLPLAFVWIGAAGVLRLRRT